MANSRLTDIFIVAPYSVIDSRRKEWKDRKAMWLSFIGDTSTSRECTLYQSSALRMPDLYVSSKSDRENNGLSFDEYVNTIADSQTLDKEKSKSPYNGVSRFDPALAEIIYHWFTPNTQSKIFDCFAGDITKGYVACKLGHSFIGIDIRYAQVEINREKANDLCVSPSYICDDGRNVLAHIGYATQDLLISCPPYYDLEVYSDDDNDASNQDTYEDYIGLLAHAFSNAIDCLKSNRFAVIIISDIRDSQGVYTSLPEDVISIFRIKNCHLYNDIIFINNDPHAKLRARRYMSNRKVVRTHQRVLVFYKGNPNSIKKYFTSI